MKTALAVFLGGLAAVAGGCATDSRVTVRSVQAAVVDAPLLPTAVYGAADGNTADFYLTDLPLGSLDPGTPLTGQSGRIVHLHMFLTPRAGSTPISSEACSVTVRHIILAGGELGVYSGGGFLLPRSDLGDEQFIGRVRDATLRLTGSTRGFADKLGAASLDATIAAQRDEAMARRIGMRVEDVIRQVSPPGGAGPSTGSAAEK
jgi:hypothetical protein